MNAKQRKFKKALEAAADALDEAKIPFHLAAGTALGATRDKKFIDHDDDIDLAVFVDDYNRSLTSKMERHGFVPKYTKNHLGTLKKGKEYSFVYSNGVPLDIFLVYRDTINNKEKYWIPSFFGICDKMESKMCKWLYRPYRPIKISLHGREYLTIPKKSLVDAYGRDWKVPKIFGYEEGMEGHEKKTKKKPLYKGLLINPQERFRNDF